MNLSDLGFRFILIHDGGASKYTVSYSCSPPNPQSYASLHCNLRYSAVWRLKMHITQRQRCNALTSKN